MYLILTEHLTILSPWKPINQSKSINVPSKQCLGVWTCTLVVRRAHTQGHLECKCTFQKCFCTYFILLVQHTDEFW